jgi:DNA repair ATPase RecN
MIISISSSYKHISSFHVVNRNALKMTKDNYFSKLSIQHWGLFERAELPLDSKPSFIVITGETGAGKSMLISALEYICGLYKKKILSQSNLDSIISLDSNHNNKVYTKVYSPRTKKTVNELAGKKVPTKDVSSDLSKSIRFWNGDSLGLLERGNEGVISYIDARLGSKGDTLFNELRLIYDEWNDVHEKLDEAIKLDKRMKKKNELELISHFESELSQFEVRLSSVLSELLEQVESMSSNESNIINDDKQDKELSLYSLTKTLNRVGLNSRKNKHNKTEDKDASLNLVEAWKAIVIGNKILSGLSIAIQTNTFLDSPLRKKTDSSPRRSSPDEIIGKARNEILQYQKQLLSLQRYMNEIGFDDSSINTKIGNTHDLFQETVVRMEELQVSLYNLDKSMPSFDNLVAKLGSVRSEWESLARKHDVVPSDLQNLKKQWAKDLKSLKNIGTDLPKLQTRYGELQRDYIKVASQITSLRKESAQSLSEKINSLLPSLEMPNKLISITVAKLFDKDNINDESKHFDYDDEEYDGIKLKFIKPGTCSTEKGWDDIYIEINQDKGTRDNNNDKVTNVLSSGELARLSLALETCSYLKHDTVDNGYSNDVKLILFDEVDAHIGGEAAVAVAKLFKAQGQFRQVIAITHNPILAAAADRHYVVSKRNIIKNDTIDYGNYISIINEVNGDSREAEIMRMASGKIDTSAGREWVRSILKIDYSIK